MKRIHHHSRTIAATAPRPTRAAAVLLATALSLPVLAISWLLGWLI